eukprot:9479637-Pyramimonas_sp.AAC.1
MKESKEFWAESDRYRQEMRLQAGHTDLSKDDWNLDALNHQLFAAAKAYSLCREEDDVHMLVGVKVVAVLPRSLVGKELKETKSKKK